MRLFDKYCCPECSGAIAKKEDEKLFCSKCSSIFRIKNGIPDFLKSGYVIGRKAGEDIIKLIDASNRIGWQEAVRQVYKEANFARCIMDYFKGNGCLVTSVKPESIVLDAGCGLGEISFFLAKICKEVHSLDFLPEYLEFMKIRATQDKEENIFPVRGSFKQIIFKKNYFDLIIINNLLEHLSDYDTNYSVQDLAIGVLRKFNQVLKPGGEIYLGIENRFGLKYWLGAKDEYTDLRFISILPRCIANLYSKLIKGKEYRDYTYSYNELKQLLQKANFKLKKVYMPVTSHKDIKFLVDLEESQSLAFAWRLMEKRLPRWRGFILKNIGKMLFFFRLHRLHLQHFFSHSFSIVAEKQAVS